MKQNVTRQQKKNENFDERRKQREKYLALIEALDAADSEDKLVDDNKRKKNRVLDVKKKKKIIL